MSSDREGRAGLVTGAAGHVARASAVAFGRAGAPVIVAALKSAREGGEETVRLAQRDGRARYVACDVARARACRPAAVAQSSTPPRWLACSGPGAGA